MHARIQPGPRFRHAAILAAAALATAAWSQSPALPTSAPASAAQNLPAAQPTQTPPAAGAQPVAPAPRAYHARVEFTGNRLSISAENSSLNDILREIAKLTGMKITGGVNDERVYGSYGPDSAQSVVNQLLDGTGTNVMLLETSQHTLAELVLTPRNGGPTPPSPNAASEEERNQENMPPTPGNRRRDFMPNGRNDRFSTNPAMGNRPTDQAPEGLQPPVIQQQPTAPTGTDATTPPPDASQQSPNGVKTPQQIYDDLVKQQAQQQQTAPTPPQ